MPLAHAHAHEFRRRLDFDAIVPPRWEKEARQLSRVWACRTGFSLTAETMLPVPTEVTRMRPPFGVPWKMCASVRIEDFAYAVDVVDLTRKHDFEVIRQRDEPSIKHPVHS